MVLKIPEVCFIRNNAVQCYECCRFVLHIYQILHLPYDLLVLQVY